MNRYAAWLIGMLAVPSVGLAQTRASLHMSYDTYAAGLQVAQVDAGLELSQYVYKMNLDYRTTGMVGFFFRGQQSSSVNGTWHDAQPVPSHFLSEGIWRGRQRIIDIDYAQGLPTVRQLVPPNADEREPVPELLRQSSIDTLSALAELIHNVDRSGRCETHARIYDGRRATDITAWTGGPDTLEPTSRSSFSGNALRCDFTGQMLSGFEFSDDRTRTGKPMRGSAWLAAVVPNGPPMPVRLTFETRWFGDATMYLTRVGPGDQVNTAQVR